MKSKLISLFLLFALLLTPTNVVHAQSPNGDIVRIGENYTLKSGDVLNGSLVVIGGNATVEKDATVNGDIVVIGGNLVADGAANGSVVIIGGNATVSSKAGGDVVTIGGQILLTKTAVVSGDVVTLGGQLTQDAGAVVAGDIINSAPSINLPNTPNVPKIPGIPNIPSAPATNLFWSAAGVFGRALVIALIAMLLALFLQPQMERVSEAAMKQPLLAGSFGLLTVVLAPLTVIIMAATLILIPVALIVVMMIPLAWLFGMIALGYEVGERFTKAVNQIWAPALSAGFGTFLLMLVVGFVGSIPCAGWLLSFMVSLVAFGGVVMTLFGSRGAPGNSAAATQVIEVPPTS
ncbi:MAG: hypothetical protein PHQ36_04575 [Anaerolineales bacterium]|nr:hypothetical protein [Anaerolineales bacterium]